MSSALNISIATFSGRGRLYSSDRKVRLGDVDSTGRLRIDSLLRYAQDFSTDDTDDSQAANSTGWVVRSVQIMATKPAQLGEILSMKTACTGLGKRWAERRIEIRGDMGANYDLAVLWICLDLETRRPTPLSRDFVEAYSEASQGRTVSARRVLEELEGSTQQTDWPLRRSDFDVYGHINNAAYGAVIEELAHEVLDHPCEIVVEYLSGLSEGSSLVIKSRVDDVSAQITYLAPDSIAAMAQLNKI